MVAYVRTEIKHIILSEGVLISKVSCDFIYNRVVYLGVTFVRVLSNINHVLSTTRF